MKELLLVGLGGGTGAIARFLLGGWITRQSTSEFPLGTLIVNVLGCLVAGALAGLAERNQAFTLETRLLLFTGLLGGFTTFSAFGLETLAMLKRGDAASALAYVAVSVAGGLAATWAAFRVIA